MQRLSAADLYELCPLYYCIIQPTVLKSRDRPSFNFESSFVGKMPSRYKWSRIYFFAKNEAKPQNKPSQTFIHNSDCLRFPLPYLPCFKHNKSSYKLGFFQSLPNSAYPVEQTHQLCMTVRTNRISSSAYITQIMNNSTITS